MNPISGLREFFRKGDVVLLALCLMASAAGLLLIYSATNYLNTSSYVIKQAAFICAGVVIYIIVTFIDIEFLMEKWWWVFLLLGIGVILLIATPLGKEVNGNKSWIYLPHVPIGIQPGEIAKLSFIVVFAWLMNRERQHGVGRFAAILKYLILTGIFAGLLAVLSGDFGMLLVYLFLFIIMAWVGGVSKWWFIGVGGGLIAGVVALWKFVLPHTSLWSDYRILRFRVVFDHALDPLGAGWQQTRSLIAIGSGQLTGMGYLKGKQTQSYVSTNLPERHTDFIFSACGEEFGLIGCTLLLILLLAIVLRCVWVSRRAKSHMSSYIAIGFAGMLMVQTLLNIGMCLFVTPVIGLTLPFISYGGSSTLTLFIAMGIVSGIKMRPLPSWLKDRSKL